MPLNTSCFRKSLNLCVHQCHRHLPARGCFHQEDLVPHQDASCVSLHTTPGNVIQLNIYGDKSQILIRNVQDSDFRCYPWTMWTYLIAKIVTTFNGGRNRFRCHWWVIDVWRKMGWLVTGKYLQTMTVTYSTDSRQEVDLGIKLRKYHNNSMPMYWTVTS